MGNPALADAATVPAERAGFKATEGLALDCPIGRVQLDDVAKAVLECWFLYFEGSLLLGCRPSLVTASRLEAVAISLEAIATGLLSAWRPSEVG